MITDCTNPARPCHLHDPRRESFRIEVAGTTVSHWWLIGALALVFLLTLAIPGLNPTP